MTKLNIVLLIIAILLILAGVCLVLYGSFKEKLENIIDKLDDSEKECLDKYNNKFDLLKKIIDFIKNKYKVDSKIFEEAMDLKIEDLNSFKHEKILNKCYKEVTQIREDNPKVRETKAFKELLTKYEDNELSIISLRTFHNKYTLIYNNMLHKFPYNIISKIKNYKIKTLIEGKELDNNYNNDLEV